MSTIGNAGSVVADAREQNQQRRSVSTQDKILDTSFSILREAGHTGLRIAMVSQESGVSRGGILHHYPTKEHLVAAVFERLIDRMEQTSRARIEAASAEDLLCELIDDARDRFFSDAYRVQLDILIASGQDKILNEVRKALVDRYQPGVQEAWASKLAAARGLDSSDAGHVVRFLWNMVKGLAVRNLVKQDDALCARVIALGLDLVNPLCGGMTFSKRAVKS